MKLTCGSLQVSGFDQGDLSPSHDDSRAMRSVAEIWAWRLPVRIRMHGVKPGAATSCRRACAADLSRLARQRRAEDSEFLILVSVPGRSSLHTSNRSRSPTRIAVCFVPSRRPATNLNKERAYRERLKRMPAFAGAERAGGADASVKKD